ncbi:MAG TPA: fibronectin, partial [bacterium]|nr:fibronectin [bacterium]
NQYDRLAFYGLPPYCEIKIFTESGDMIWSVDHNDGSGDELWDSQTKYGQIVVSGVYLAYFEVTRDVFDEGTGEKLFAKGDHIIRKFVVIR